MKQYKMSGVMKPSTQNQPLLLLFVPLLTICILCWSLAVSRNTFVISPHESQEQPWVNDVLSEVQHVSVHVELRGADQHQQVETPYQHEQQQQTEPLLEPLTLAPAEAAKAAAAAMMPFVAVADVAPLAAMTSGAMTQAAEAPAPNTAAVEGAEAAAAAFAAATLLVADDPPQLAAEQTVMAAAAAAEAAEGNTTLQAAPKADVHLKLHPEVQLEGVPPDGETVTLAGQLTQARKQKLQLTNQQLEYAGPLLYKNGTKRNILPERREPGDYPSGYVAICAVVKDQHNDLREWLEYHRYIGVRKVYVYDNNSTVPLAAGISDMMQAGFVEYVYFAGAPRHKRSFRTTNQWHAYNDCLTRFRLRHRWMAFIDADEFIVMHDHHLEGFGNATASNRSSTTGGTSSSSSNAVGASKPDIKLFTKSYEKFGGLGLNWVIFGSSGHKQRPDGGTLVNYHKCMPPFLPGQNTHVKVMANTEHVLTVGDDPHTMYYRNPDKYFTVNELGERVKGARTSTASQSKISLYHYLLKSEDEYRQKMVRGSGAGNHKGFSFFEAVDKQAGKKCLHGVQLGLECCPSVRQALGPQGVQGVTAQLKDMQATAATVAASQQ